MHALDDSTESFLKHIDILDLLQEWIGALP
jgi:hypothetical protein